MITDDEKKQLQEAVDRNLEPMKASTLFLGLYAPEMRKDPVALIQMGLAIILDKPIAVVAFDDDPIPKALEKIAFITRRARRADPESVHNATTEILNTFKNEIAEPHVNVDVSINEMGVILTALSTLHALQPIKQPHELTDDERAYLASIDSVLEKLCERAGLGEHFARDAKVEAMRELVRKKNCKQTAPGSEGVH